MKYGIQVVEKPNGFADNDFIYDSTKNKLQVILDSTFHHMGIVEIDHQGTAWGPTGSEQKETLWSMEHKLSFIPRIQMYFLVGDAPAGGFVIGSYFGSSVVIAAAPMLQEYLYYEVDASELRIVHSYYGEPGAASASLNQYVFRIKYMIQPVNRYIPRVDLGSSGEPG